MLVKYSTTLVLGQISLENRIVKALAAVGLTSVDPFHATAPNFDGPLQVVHPLDLCAQQQQIDPVNAL